MLAESKASRYVKVQNMGKVKTPKMWVKKVKNRFNVEKNI